jgi:biotin carboxyl carrier protein
LLEELATLLQRNPPPAEFYAEFLPRILTVLRGVAGAIWLRTADGQFQLQYQINRASVGLEKFAGGAASFAELLAVASRREEPFWLLPQTSADADERHTNPTLFGLLLAPIRLEQKVVGAIEIWQEPTLEVPEVEGAAHFLAQVASFAAAYVHKAQVRQLQDSQQEWSRLERLCRRLHASLTPREVAFTIANDGRDFLGCDQASVALRLGRNACVEAISGVAQLAERSRLVKLMQALSTSVLRWGGSVLYQGTRDESLPPYVLSALDAYLAESNSRVLFVTSLRDPRDKSPTACRSVLLVENFDSSVSADQMRERVELLAAHAASALYNAVEHARVPFARLTRGIGRVRDWLRERHGARLGAILLAAALVVSGLLFIPAGLRLEATGQLLPKERQTVYAPFSGRIVELKAQAGDLVDKGQELLYLEDLDTQLKIEQLTIKISAAEHRLAVLNEQLGKSALEEDRNAFIKERINQEYELRKAIAERNILSQGSRNPQFTPLVAPLAGKIVTFDAREQLIGKTVKPGDALLRVAQFQGSWEIELLVPEQHIGQIRKGLSASAAEALDVDLLLTSHPNRVYRGTLRKGNLGGETTLKDNKVVLPCWVQITDPELVAQLDAMPLGVEVRAKVHCGERSLGYVWFGGLLEFFYEHVWF